MEEAMEEDMEEVMEEVMEEDMEEAMEEDIEASWNVKPTVCCPYDSTMTPKKSRLKSRLKKKTTESRI